MNCLRLKTCRLDLFCVLNALGPEGEPYSMILQGHTGGEFESPNHRRLSCTLLFFGGQLAGLSRT